MRSLNELRSAVSASYRRQVPSVFCHLQLASSGIHLMSHIHLGSSFTGLRRSIDLPQCVTLPHHPQLTSRIFLELVGLGFRLLDRSRIKLVTQLFSKLFTRGFQVTLRCQRMDPMGPKAHLVLGQTKCLTLVKSPSL